MAPVKIRVPEPVVVHEAATPLAFSRMELIVNDWPLDTLTVVAPCAAMAPPVIEFPDPVELMVVP